jgi:hypothetical protein
MKGILSAPSSGLLHLLAKITMDPCDVLKCLKKYLVNHSDENWVVVDTLLTLLAKKFSTEEENGITKAVREHIYEMTKTPAEICNDFAYLVEDDDAPIDENELMGQFLIWLLNFPNDKLKIRVFKILQWLTDKVTAILLPLFIKEALSNKPDEATELCAYLLLTYSQKNKMAVWDQILNNDEIGNKIIETKHFMVKYCFLEIMKSDENDKKLKIQRIYERLTDKFPVNTGRNGSQNNLDCNVFGPIMHIIDLLNYRKILDIGFEYQMKEELQKHLASLNNVDFIQSDVFVNRSFGNGSKEHFYRYEAVLQHVLNICITRLVPITRLGEVASILKRRQFYENARI